MAASASSSAMERGAGAPGAAAAIRLFDAAEIDAARAAEWMALTGAASEPNPFVEPWFLAPSLRHYAERPVRLLEMRTGSRLDGALLLDIEPHYGRVPVAHVENWRHHQLFLGAPLVRQGREAAFWEKAIRALDAADRAPGFLHLVGLVEGGALHRGLETAAAALGRSCAIVYREERAFLSSDLSPDAYYEQTVRKKKRKELARLRNRLAEEGQLESRTFGAGDDLDSWCDAFLALECAGWKGEAGSALASTSAGAAFFREVIAGAAGAGRLQFLRLDLDGRPIAMLANFLTPPGSFSFKTAFDERYARFSPGVHIQRDNLEILARPDIDWMDSCAASDHPMIDSLWAQRRSIIRVTVPLAGVRRRIVFTAARALERASAARRRLVNRAGTAESASS